MRNLHKKTFFLLSVLPKEQYNNKKLKLRDKTRLNQYLLVDIKAWISMYCEPCISTYCNLATIME